MTSVLQKPIAEVDHAVLLIIVFSGITALTGFPGMRGFARRYPVTELQEVAEHTNCGGRDRNCSTDPPPTGGVGHKGRYL